MAIYTQVITGSDPEGGQVTFQMTGPGASIPNTSLNDPGVGGAGTADFIWDTSGVTSKVDTTITFKVIDSYGAEDAQTVTMKSWFAPSINTIDDISTDVGTPYSTTIVAASHEPTATLVWSYNFPAGDEPADWAAGFTDNGDGTASIVWPASSALPATTVEFTITDTSSPITPNMTASQTVNIEAIAVAPALEFTLPSDSVFDNQTSYNDTMFNLMGITSTENPLGHITYTGTDAPPDTWLWEFIEWSTDGINWNPAPRAGNSITFSDPTLENPTMVASTDLFVQYKLRLTATNSTTGATAFDDWVFESETS